MTVTINNAEQVIHSCRKYMENHTEGAMGTETLKQIESVADGDIYTAIAAALCIGFKIGYDIPRA